MGAQMGGAILRGNAAANIAEVHHHVLVAGLFRHILGVDIDIGHPVDAANITAAGLGCQLSGVQADRHSLEGVAVVQRFLGKSRVDGLHNLAPQHRRRVGTDIDLLGLVIAHPDRRGIVAGVAAEPAVPVGGGGARLAGDGLAAKDGSAAGAVVGGIVQAVIHIIDGLFTENLPAVLGIVHHQLSVAVIDLRIESGLPEHAVIGKGSVGRGHLLNGGAQGQGAQGQRGQAHVRLHLIFRRILLHQALLAEVVLGKAVAILLADIVQSAHGNGVDRGHDALVHRPGVLILPVVVLGPVAVGIGNGQILKDRCRGDLTGLEGRGIDGNGLLGGAGLKLCLGSTVVAHESLLFSHAAGQSHHIAGGIVDHHDGRLELLVAAGGGNIVKVGVNLVHLLLNIHVQSGVDVVAALLDAVQIDIAAVFVQIVPGLSVLLGKIGGEIHDHRVHEPGIDMLGSIGLDAGGAAADGAVAHIAVAVKVLPGCFVAALGIAAHGPAVLVGNALLEHHLLIYSFLVFLVGEVALVVHLAEDVQLAVAVSPRAVPLLALVLVDAYGIGIEQRGVIGNADEAGALSRGQALQFLAEILCRRALDAVTATAQIDLIEVILHNEVFVVLPFKELGPENLHDFPLNGDALLLGQVFHQLLGNGGAAELLVSAEEHIQAGFDGGDPVNTLMLVKPLVLNGDSGMHQILGNLVQGCPLAIRGGVDLLKLLNITIAVHIVNKGSPFQVIVLHGPVACLLQNIILKIVAQSSHKHRAADQHDQQHRRSRADGDLNKGKGHGTGGIHQLDQPVGIPLLPGLFPSPFKKVIFCHRIPP